MLEALSVPATPNGRDSQTPLNIRHMVLKLRWIGLTDEADLLANEMARFAPAEILIDITETD